MNSNDVMGLLFFTLSLIMFVALFFKDSSVQELHRLATTGFLFLIIGNQYTILSKLEKNKR